MTNERLTEIEKRLQVVALGGEMSQRTIVLLDVPDLCAALREAWAEIEKLKLVKNP